jgi:hypothetical protein
MHPSTREIDQRDRDPGLDRFSKKLIRGLWPFHLFQDATRGDMYARAAAYRHNRRMRGNLPGYFMKWMLGSFIAWLSICGFDALAAPTVGGQVNVFVLMAAGCGIVFVYAVCVMVVTISAYVYLSQHEQ